MARAVILVHAECEGPGRLAKVLTDEGFSLDVRAVHRGDEVPSVLDPGALLVVMGGSMGVGDRNDPEYAFLGQEIELLDRRVRDRAPVLGICLGAQLLAHAAGARVYPMRTRMPRGAHYEVGWGDVHFEPSRRRVLEGMPDAAPMLHWHGDTFDLPPGARRLAWSRACEQQAFQIHDRLFGLQFHAEVDVSDIEGFLRGDAEFVVRANGPAGIDRVRRDTERHFARFEAVSERLLRNVVREMVSS